MGLKDLSSMAKILLQLSANSKPFDENDGKKPLVTQSTVITTEDHMTEGDGDDAHHQSTGLILRPLLTKLSQDEKNMLRELLSLLELDMVQFKEALQAKGLSLKDFMTMFNQNGLVIPLSSPQYRAAFIQKLANLDLLPKDYKSVQTKSPGRQTSAALSNLSLFSIKPSSSDEITHSQQKSLLSPFSKLLKPKLGITIH